MTDWVINFQTLLEVGRLNYGCGVREFSDRNKETIIWQSKNIM